MKKLILSIFTIAFILSFSKNTFGQEDFQVAIQNIEEERKINQNYSRLTMTAIITGLVIDDYHLLRLKSAEAIDDKGKTLKKKETHFLYEKKFSVKNDFKIETDVPMRQSEQISSLKGVFEYYEASKEKVIKFTNSPNNYNKNLLENTNTTDTKLVLIDLKEIIELKNSDLVKFEEKIKTISNALKINQTDEEIRTEVIDFVEKKSRFKFRDQEGMFFLVRGDIENIISLNLYNRNGEKIESRSVRYNDDSISVALRENSENDWQIDIITKDEESIKEIPFEVKNIKLP